jgi:hypothetical protein
MNNLSDLCEKIRLVFSNYSNICVDSIDTLAYLLGVFEGYSN